MAAICLDLNVLTESTDNPSADELQSLDSMTGLKIYS